jgi:hypothetical protein
MQWVVKNLPSGGPSVLENGSDILIRANSYIGTNTNEKYLSTYIIVKN